MTSDSERQVRAERILDALEVEETEDLAQDIGRMESQVEKIQSAKERGVLGGPSTPL